MLLILFGWGALTNPLTAAGLAVVLERLRRDLKNNDP